MKLFDPENHQKSDAHRRLYAICELAYTIIDVAAAAFFVIGSILFFNESTIILGTWLFLFGSIMFGLRPSITLYREIKYIRLGRYDD